MKMGLFTFFLNRDIANKALICYRNLSFYLLNHMVAPLGMCNLLGL